MIVKVDSQVKSPSQVVLDVLREFIRAIQLVPREGSCQRVFLAGGLRGKNQTKKPTTCKSQLSSPALPRSSASLIMEALHPQCYNQTMKKGVTPSIHTGSGADLAFAVVVLTAYFVTFSSIRNASTTEIILLTVLGVLYVVIGIYGYSFCSRSGSSALRLAYFVVQIAIGTAIVYLGRGTGLNAMVFLPLAAHSVVLLPTAWMYAVNLVILAAFVLTTYTYTQSLSGIWNTFQVFLAGIIFVVVFTTMAISEEKARRQIETLVANLEQANQRLREYALQAETFATTRERNRLAREIHDGLGHYLTAINMQIQAARAIHDSQPEQAFKSLETTQNLVHEALQDVRRSVAALRAPEDESEPLVDQINNLISAHQAADLEIQLDVRGQQRALPANIQQTLYRATQEGLHNIITHANASLAEITLDYTQPTEMVLTISDNGSGAETWDSGFGLLGLRERLNILNGTVDIHTRPGAGFTLDIRIPYES